ncbi:hypothetical protein [Microbispora sp. GKU 823]|uniref:hypothetical protein n=1 Tax=Microbispora sp. GKU 823 TaxID=1652100 RepID=UPI0009A3284A|nr:hypothetical protein [Microbispora sp. GKU 823]OPG13646.1 hypothetical protein B1L11_06575 [Microbispora sp. GKU 823]
MTEPTTIQAVINDALRHVVADLFPGWAYKDGDRLCIREQPGQHRTLAWMERGDQVYPPTELGDDATQKILTAMLKHVERK